MRTNRLKSRAGSTLVRLLVVIAIIGVSLGWLLPAAVRQACDAAGRSQFWSNLKQQALAVANSVGAFGNQRRTSPYLNHEDVGVFSGSGGYGQQSTGSGLPPWLGGGPTSPYVDHDSL